MRGAFPQVTVNDVLLALVTGTLRDYLAAHDELPTGPIRTTSPAQVPASERKQCGQSLHHDMDRPARAPEEPPRSGWSE